MSTFADFANAISRPDRPAAPAPRALSRVAVLGGGQEGRMLAAIALSEGAQVALFSAYGAELDAMKGGIALRGAGPVGSYQVNADGAPSVQALSVENWRHLIGRCRCPA